MNSIQSFLKGTWMYRSFHNNPSPVADPDKLLFGKGKMVFENKEVKHGEVNGYFDFGNDYRLNFKGWVTDGNPAAIRFKGVGIPDTATEGWIYDYMAYISNPWPNGIDQRSAMTGSVIRTASHSNGNSPAGYTASFYAC